MQISPGDVSTQWTDREEDQKSDDWNLSHMWGIRIIGKYPEQCGAGEELLHTLVKMQLGGTLSFLGGLSREDNADLVVLIGPKGTRS